MAAPSRTPLPDLPKGHEFSPTTFSVSADDVSRYIDAVGDGNAVYAEQGLAPPLAIAAHGLGALLEVIELPGGSLHSNQEVEWRAGVEAGAFRLTGRIAQRSERAGMIISVIEFEVSPEGADEPAVTGRTTVLVEAPDGAG
ncbi:MAG: MaoC family dehydratase N-terminal domain-containing protein [Chloroflexi bacterium]|nr:MaoC family dehydratase N-terminal domain-containing protein [Chloroflexota bacterium]